MAVRPVIRPGRRPVLALGVTAAAALACGPDSPGEATADSTAATTEASTTLVPTGGTGDTGSPGDLPAFDPCAAGEVETIAQADRIGSLHLLADMHGWQVAYRSSTPNDPTPTGLRFVRPGGEAVVLDAVDREYVAALRTGEGVLVCWDDGITSKTRDHGFCMATDEQLKPVSEVVHVAYRRVRELVEFPDVRHALAERGAWSIDGQGAPLGEPLMLGASPLAFGADWLLGERFVEPACPNPEENALCVREYAPFSPHGQQLAPFLPLTDTTLAPDERLYAAISGDNYLLAWTDGGPWELRVVTRESELVRSQTLEREIAGAFATPQGFVFVVLLAGSPGEEALGLWPFDGAGAALSAPVAIAEIAAETSLTSIRIAAFGGGLAAAWVTEGGLLDEHREVGLFRALGCAWPPAP